MGNGKRPDDNGYSFIVLLAAFGMQIILALTSRTVDVYTEEVHNYYGAKESFLHAIIALQTACNVLGEFTMDTSFPASYWQIPSRIKLINSKRNPNWKTSIAFSPSCCPLNSPLWISTGLLHWWVSGRSGLRYFQFLSVISRSAHILRTYCR